MDQKQSATFPEKACSGEMNHFESNLGPKMAYLNKSGSIMLRILLNFAQ